MGCACNQSYIPNTLEFQSKKGVARKSKCVSTFGSTGARAELIVFFFFCATNSRRGPGPVGSCQVRISARVRFCIQRVSCTGGATTSRDEATPDGLAARVGLLARRLPRIEASVSTSIKPSTDKVASLSHLAVQRVEESLDEHGFPMPMPPPLHVDLHFVLADQPPVMAEVQNRVPSSVLPVEVRGLQPFDTAHTASYKDLVVLPANRAKPIRPKPNGIVLANDPHPIDGTTASRSYVRPAVPVRPREMIRPIGKTHLASANEWTGAMATTSKSTYTAWSGLQRRKPILPKLGSKPFEQQPGSSSSALTRSTSDSAFVRYDNVPRRQPIYPSHTENPLRVQGAGGGLMQSTSRAYAYATPYVSRGGVDQQPIAGRTKPLQPGPRWPT